MKFAGQVPQSRQNGMFLDATLNKSELIHVCMGSTIMSILNKWITRPEDHPCYVGEVEHQYGQHDCGAGARLHTINQQLAGFCPNPGFSPQLPPV